MHKYRTHTCGELREKHEGFDVKVSGWLSRTRDHGGVLFVDVRDHYGVTQCVVRTDSPFFKTLESLTYESVITVSGRVVKRSAETVNSSLDTGSIEVVVEGLECASVAQQVPFPLGDEYEEAGESTRLQYRFLDLRRTKMQKHIKLRSEVIKTMRASMEAQGFLEIQTPILTASSPEGARDFLVPSRVHPGKFYALPQAPQIYKQILMTSGFDKYFQVAPCFRDEDARADRAPGEFYQLDLEMSFVEQKDVLKAVEGVMDPVFECGSLPFNKAPYPLISHEDALNKYGSDKPDLRNPLSIIDVSSFFAKTNFKVFAETVQKGGMVRAIMVPNVADKPRSFFDKMNFWAQEKGAPGLGYVISSSEGLKGPIAKTLTEEEQKTLAQICSLEIGGAVFFVCSKNHKFAKLFAGEARTALGEATGCIKKDQFITCWVVDFPLFEKDDKTGALLFSHNPFSRPLCTLEEFANKDPLTIMSNQYDLVCNGVEIGSGAIRNNNPEFLKQVFIKAGYKKEQIEKDFQGMLKAFSYGAPPHGGCAPGIDRIVMLLAGVANIREVVAFPKNQLGVDVLMQAPNFVEKSQLKDVHISSNCVDAKHEE